MRWNARVMAGAVACSVAVLVGCGTKKPDPTPLEPLTPKASVRQVWKQNIGGVTYPLSVASPGNAFVVADDRGTVMALQADSGQEIWRTQINARISAGVGSDGRFASVVTTENDLVTVEGGNVLWRAKLPSRVVTAPLVAGERVFVLCVDRTVHAFDAIDGRKLWSYQRPSEALSLSQPGVLVPFKDTLLAGLGAKLAGIDPLHGTLRWDATVASPRGTNEVERLADLVAPVAREGDVVCVRAFQSAVACIDAERAAPRWARNATGLAGIAANSGVVLGLDGSDRLTAWRFADGNVAWTNEKYLFRGLSAPATLGQAFVVGDGEGVVHWLASDTGEALLRQSTDRSPIRVTPAVSGSTLLAVTREGGLFAFRAQ